MRIGQVNQDNYKEMLKLFGGNNSKSLDNLLGKDEKNKFAKTEEEKIEMLVKQGYVLEGTHVKEGDDSWKKIIPVSDEIRNKLLDLARSEFINNNGMTDGEELSSLIYDYAKNSPANERPSTGWTLSSIFREESLRLTEIVKANVPGWQHGQPFDKSILDDYISGGLDIRA